MASINVTKIAEQAQLELAYQIRREVFVEEQKVAEEEEIDEFENESIHFLAYMNDVPAGAARWRFTDKGVKLERFAVKKIFRGKGIGSALVNAVLSDIRHHKEASGKLYYLHSQLDAVPLYLKFGFQKQGDIFEECNIKHYKMILNED
jgi:predicted GNAT family N-acyltransferase